MTDLGQAPTEIGFFSRAAASDGPDFARKRLASGSLRSAPMAKLRLPSLLALAALSTGGILALPQQPSRARPAPSTSAAPARDAAESRRARPRGYVGEVVSVTPADGTFTARETLHDGSPKTTTFRTTAQTRFTCGKEPCTLADVKVNDHVTVKYADAAKGEHKALTVRVTPAARPKPPAGPSSR